MKQNGNHFNCNNHKVQSNIMQQTHISEISKNRKAVVRNQKILIASVALVAIVAMICIFLFDTIRIQAAPSEISYKYYTSIEVQSGDTLWAIASDYITDNYQDMNEYIDEVCSINHISENEIHSGQYITIPYYSTKKMK